MGKVIATVEAASWLLVAASLIMMMLNHFIGTAALQKKQDDNTPIEMRLHTDRWDQDAAPEATVHDVIHETEDETVKESAQIGDDSDEKVNVAPILPRFTDYYSFATVATQRQWEQPGKSFSGEYDIEKSKATAEPALIAPKEERNNELQHAPSANAASANPAAQEESPDDDKKKREEVVEMTDAPDEDRPKGS